MVIEAPQGNRRASLFAENVETVALSGGGGHGAVCGALRAEKRFGVLPFRERFGGQKHPHAVDQIHRENRLVFEHGEPPLQPEARLRPGDDVDVARLNGFARRVQARKRLHRLFLHVLPGIHSASVICQTALETPG